MSDVSCSIRRSVGKFWMTVQILILLGHRLDDGDYLVIFHEAQKAVASGQIVAVWDGDWCLGSGTIKDSW